jgi:hypothetical protein
VELTASARTNSGFAVGRVNLFSCNCGHSVNVPSSWWDGSCRSPGRGGKIDREIYITCPSLPSLLLLLVIIYVITL